MLPAILIGKKDRYMPVEHCIIEKGQKVVKKFDEIMTSKIIKVRWLNRVYPFVLCIFKFQEAAVPAPTRIRNIVTMVEKAQLASGMQKLQNICHCYSFYSQMLSPLVLA